MGMLLARVCAKYIGVAVVQLASWRWVRPMCVALLTMTAGIAAASTTIVAAPPAPFSGSTFDVAVFGRSTGAPLILSAEMPSVVGNSITLTLHVTRTTSNTLNSPYSATFRLPALAAGGYTINYYTDYEERGPIFDASGIVKVVPPTSKIEAVEFYNQARDHYFMTADPHEIELLDAGQFPGWSRTGELLKVYESATDVDDSLLAPVCRYYGLPSAGLDTHFFSAFSAECSAILELWPDQWVLETANAFRVFLPNSQYSTDFVNPDPGTCPPGTAQVFRLYNNRADVNHRYTTSMTVRDQMISLGWIPEGYGQQAVGFCALPES